MVAWATWRISLAMRTWWFALSCAASPSAASAGHRLCCYGAGDVRVHRIRGSSSPALVVSNFLCPGMLQALAAWTNERYDRGELTMPPVSAYRPGSGAKDDDDD